MRDKIGARVSGGRPKPSWYGGLGLGLGYGSLGYDDMALLWPRFRAVARNLRRPVFYYIHIHIYKCI